MSKIVKGIGKAVKKIGRAVGKVFKGIKKVFKKVWESSIGRAILIGAAIFVGGGLIGLWNTPGWLGGAGTTASSSASTGVGQAVSAANTAGTTSAGTVAGTGGAAGGAGAGAAAGAGELAAAGAGAVGGGSGAAAGVVPVVESVGVAGAGAGLPAAPGTFAAIGEATTAAGKIFKTVQALGSAAKGAGQGLISFAKANPTFTSSLASGVSQAFAPNEYDEQFELENRRLDRAFSGIGDVNVPRASGETQLKRSDGRPVYASGGGLIRSHMRPPRNRFIAEQGGTV